MMRRRLDHLVLPTDDLAVARARLTALGFTVAPDGHHPLGTSNCCVFLADGTYLEPLAATDLEKIEEAIEASNVFVSRFVAYRFRRGAEGFSGIAFTSDDALADHSHFQATGMSAGQVLEFSRKLAGAGGDAINATFRLAFAEDARAPDFLPFTVQRVNFPERKSTAQTGHKNGVTGISRVVFGAPQAGYFVQSVAVVADIDSASLTAVADGFASVQVGDIHLDFMDNRVIERIFGMPSNDDRGLQGRAVAFGVRSLHEAEAQFAANSVVYTQRGNRLIVPPAPGQGAIFVFESNE